MFFRSAQATDTSILFIRRNGVSCVAYGQLTATARIQIKAILAALTRTVEIVSRECKRKFVIISHI